METVRDLGRVEPWQESLERSRARRQRSKRQSTQVAGRRRNRQRTGDFEPGRDRRAVSDRRPRRGRRPGRAVTSRALTLAAGAAAILILAVIGTLAGASSGRNRPAGAAAPPPILHAESPGYGPGTCAAAARKAPVCGPVTGRRAYVNPLSRARVTPERIDQGVDYAGSGTLVAIGAATVTYVGTSNTGWPGAFIEYRLLSGPDTGCYIYYAEGVNPRPGLHVGQTLAAGQSVAGIVPGWSSGVEIGWGAGVSTKTAASRGHAWTPSDDEDNVATAAGKSFSALITSLGGPPGKVEG